HPNDFFQKLINPFSLFTPRPYPSYSKQYKLALAKKKELYKSIDEFKRLGFKDLENAYQTYMSSFIINEELNSKDKTINKNENKEINKNLNQE
ncbi:hypothetical protein KJQ82_08830, partial [Campylobacter lari]|uniref:hypothetical protein n=1 Tax=Campylobacter lari TaxID=201 RepID=UPI001BD21218